MNNVDVMAKNHFTSLIGAELQYYGADEAERTFMVDGVVFLVREDPSDGYRSYMDTVTYDLSESIFFREPVATVVIEEYDGTNEDDEGWNSTTCKGFRLVDSNDGHVWLQFGTNNYDDYYPCFIFRHNAKTGEQ